MSNNRSAILAGTFGCLIGAMIPLVLGASQSPEEHFPHYTVVSNNGFLWIVDNKTNQLHIYSGPRRASYELSYTMDLTQVGDKTIGYKYAKGEEDQKKVEEMKDKKTAPAP